MGSAGQTEKGGGAVIAVGSIDFDDAGGSVAAGECHAIVLAGGRGRRLEGFTGRCEGRFGDQPVPKQFATFGLGTSLLQRTMQRVFDLWLVRRMHIVVDASQALLAQQQMTESDKVHLVLQPADRGTAAGVMLPLASVMRENPEAMVLLTPSDHAIGNEDLYRRGIFKALGALASGVTGIVLFGVRADSPRTDYGWIVPGRALGSGVREVARFVEKPTAETARGLHAEGALWSTMVVAAHARALWDVLKAAAPELGEVFEAANAMSEPSGERFLRREYAAIPQLDFSRDVLGTARGVSVMAWPRRIAWSDLGTPDRLVAWLGGAPVTAANASEVGGGQE